MARTPKLTVTHVATQVSPMSRLITVVELRGFEPLTFSMRTRRATNCAIAPSTLAGAESKNSTAGDVCSAKVRSGPRDLAI